MEIYVTLDIPKNVADKLIEFHLKQEEEPTDMLETYQIDEILYQLAEQLYFLNRE